MAWNFINLLSSLEILSHLVADIWTSIFFGRLKFPLLADVTTVLKMHNGPVLCFSSYVAIKEYETPSAQP